MERLETRHRAMPEVHADPSYFRNEPKVRDIWKFLQDLDRPELQYVDASGSEDQTYQKVKQYVTYRIGNLVAKNPKCSNVRRVSGASE